MMQSISLTDGTVSKASDAAKDQKMNTDEMSDNAIEKKGDFSSILEELTNADDESSDEILFDLLNKIDEDALEGALSDGDALEGALSDGDVIEGALSNEEDILDGSEITDKTNISDSSQLENITNNIDTVDISEKDDFVLNDDDKITADEAKKLLDVKKDHVNDLFDLKEKQDKISVQESLKLKGTQVNNVINSKENQVNSVLNKIETARKVDTKLTNVNSLGMKDGEGKSEETNQNSTLLKPQFNMKIPDFQSAQLTNSQMSETTKGDEVISKEIKLANINNTLTTKGTELSSKEVQSSRLHEPLDLQSKQAAQNLTDRVLMMVNQNKQEVTIRLDPAELGTLQIKVRISNDQLMLNIQANVGQTKEFLEQNLSRLRDQLSQQGINLGEANIEQQQQKNSEKESDSSSLSVINEGEDELMNENSEDTAMWENSLVAGSDQKVDYYV
ncbi:MAG: flagellar hook-length control protein FliK [Psychromonas sp.]|nr:flagellar hook-length control protein FliK [Psychromonas sp.]